MPHGGKRPGAGVPNGNFNAFKHGKHSLQYKELIDTISSDSQLRDRFISYYKLQRERRRAKQAALVILSELAQRALITQEQFNQAKRRLNKAETRSKNRNLIKSQS